MPHGDFEVTMRRSQRRPTTAIRVCALTLVFVVSGCAFGPRVLEQTHGRYNEAVRQVEEEELLRNLVHLRYNEYPST
jgi:hypothetical protein